MFGTKEDPSSCDPAVGFLRAKINLREDVICIYSRHYLGKIKLILLACMERFIPAIQLCVIIFSTIAPVGLLGHSK
jgi:hypothetical protein